jgi:5-formyltetrahydrofolate cyclo-ligase
VGRAFRALYLVNKRDRRTLWLTQRRTIPPHLYQTQNQALCDALAQHPTLNQPGALVLSYFSIRQEPDLSSLLSLPNLRWGFPRVVGEDLCWHEWRSGDALIPGSFNIPEPAATAPRVLPKDVDLMLVPCLGADRRGYRLGYGGGYYDRLLANPAWQSVKTLGVTFGAFLMDRLDMDPWDLPLQEICTEQGCFPARVTG